MGAWTFVEPNIERVLDYIERQEHQRPLCRPRRASRLHRDRHLMSRHLKELKAFLDEALAPAALSPHPRLTARRRTIQ